MQEKPLPPKNNKKTNLGAKSNNTLPPKVIFSNTDTDKVNLSDADLADLIKIAYIVRPQGLKGEVVATIETDFPDRFDELDKVFLVYPDGKIEQVSLENYWLHKERVVLKLSNCSDRNTAETLRNVLVKIPSSELIELPEEYYYEFDLIGCQVITNTGLNLGTVQELMYTGPAPLLVIKGHQEYLIPLAEEICYEINTQEKKILVNPPEGLLDL